MSTNYTKTGNSIPININEATIYIEQKLEEYEMLPNKEQNYPFNKAIIYKTSDGKLVEIPKEIQDKIINEWYKKKGNNTINGINYTEHEYTDINYDNSTLGLNNQDHKFKSSIQPFSKLDSMEIRQLKNNPNIIHERNFAKDSNTILYENPQIYDKTIIDETINVHPDISTNHQPQHSNVIIEDTTPKKNIIIKKDNSSKIYIYIGLIVVAIITYIYIKNKNN